MSTRTTIGLSLLGLALFAAGAWGLSKALHRSASPTAATRMLPAATPSQPVAHISATLYFRAADDDLLVPVRQEVPLGSSVAPATT